MTPSKSGCTFSPTSSSVTITSANVTGRQLHRLLQRADLLDQRQRRHHRRHRHRRIVVHHERRIEQLFDVGLRGRNLHRDAEQVGLHVLPRLELRHDHLGQRDRSQLHRHLRHRRHAAHQRRRADRPERGPERLEVLLHHRPGRRDEPDRSPRRRHRPTSTSTRSSTPSRRRRLHLPPLHLVRQRDLLGDQSVLGHLVGRRERLRRRQLHDHRHGDDAGRDVLDLRQRRHLGRDGHRRLAGRDQRRVEQLHRSAASPTAPTP